MWKTLGGGKPTPDDIVDFLLRSMIDTIKIFSRINIFHKNIFAVSIIDRSKSRQNRKIKKKFSRRERTYMSETFDVEIPRRGSTGLRQHRRLFAPVDDRYYKDIF